MSLADTYAERFAEAEPTLPGAAIGWLNELRREALAAFVETGLPTPRLESWKYTNLKGLMHDAMPLAPRLANGIGRDAVAPFCLADVACTRLVFVNGGLRPDLSETPAIAGVAVGSLAAALEADDSALHALFSERTAPTPENAVQTLNAVFMTDGALIRIDPGAAPDQPLHLVFLTVPQAMPAATHTRNVIVASRDSAATVIETHAALGDGLYWTNSANTVVLETGARLHHYRVQAEAQTAWHLAATTVDVAAGASYESFTAAFGARLSRHEIETRLGAECAQCALNGIYLGRGSQHVDNTTRILHTAPGGRCRETYRGVLDDKSRAVFQGKIVVAPGAQRTDAHQLNENLLLSETAEADSKPELEINADDVKCSHGATAGALDEEALFYLQSRGIDRETASGMLIEAFLADLVDDLQVPALTSWLRREIDTWLGAGGDSP